MTDSGPNTGRSPTSGEASPRVTVWLTVAAVLVGCTAPEPSANVILVSVDTLRADHLSVYGYGRRTSPNLEALAEEGAVFETFVNNGGGTLPSHLTMMTSLYPDAHGVTPNNGLALAPDETTLAEHLREAGYSTAGFVDSGWMKGRFGFVQGFDLFDDEGGRLEAILPKALEWLHRNRDRRFFLFLHTYDVHSQSQAPPYHCPGDFKDLYTSAFEVDSATRGIASRQLALWNEKLRTGELEVGDVLREDEIAYMEALYDGCINYVDDQLGKLMRELKDLGLYERALIVVTSDHGEEFADHGLFMHSRGGYEEVARIPLILKLPFSRAGGQRIPHLAAMVDLMPTVLDITDVAVGDRAQGKSLLPAISNGERIREATHIQRVVRTQTWKYFDDEGRLFDLAADPDETVDVADREVELISRLGAFLESQHRRDLELQKSRTSTSETVTLSPEELRRLEALGYVN